ncbi:unnamed protein product [Boreogadus saida]
MGPEKQAPPQIPNGVSGMCSVKGNVLSSVSSHILNPSKAVPGTSLRQSGGKVWILLGVRGHGPEPYYLLETLRGSEVRGQGLEPYYLLETVWGSGVGPEASWRQSGGQGSLPGALLPPGNTLGGSDLNPPGDNVGVRGHGLEPYYLLETFWVSGVGAWSITTSWRHSGGQGSGHRALFALPGDFVSSTSHVLLYNLGVHPATQGISTTEGRRYHRWMRMAGHKEQRLTSASGGFC